MNERRARLSASLSSLLIVTLASAWACSSSDLGDASVTTGSGASSEVVGGRPALSESGAEHGMGGTIEWGSAGRMNEGGTVDELPPLAGHSSAGAEPAAGGRGADAAGAASLAVGGVIDMNGAGEMNGAAPGAETPGAGSSAVGGAPAVVETVCDPAQDRSTPDLFLPCDVSTALYVCRNCHTNPPVKGVFSSYVTFADVKASAPQIYAVIKSGTMPRPPYTMSAWQKTTALRWLGKDGSCAIGAGKSCQ
jgi:hypothetical protein